MFRQLLNIRMGLTLVAVAIITGTIFYSNFLSKKIELEEREKISQWIEANKFVASAPENADLALAIQIQQQNNDIPIVWTNENDSIIDSRNLDQDKVHSIKYLERKLKEFQTSNDPIIIILNKEPFVADKYYYGDSKLLKQVKYFPIVQLIIVALFIIIIFYSISVRNKSTQNQVWAGMAKETAHQLGTPISSLQGWVEMLKERTNSQDISEEMEKDVNRLKLISDRFGKIGSSPKLEPSDIILQVEKIVAYIKRMSTEKVVFIIENENENISADISPPLFDWVIENLLKNALDAMDGQGIIKLHLISQSGKAIIDISDTGKGISKQNISKIFKPGFTTKKRGWGLGLSLCKRIIEQYHNGKLDIKSTEVGKGTTFRIILNT